MRAEWLASCQHTRDSPQSVRLQSVLGSHQQDKHHQHHQHHQQYQHHQHPPHSDQPLTGTAECEIFVPLTWWHLTPGKEGTEEGVTVTLTKVKLELLLNFLSLSLLSVVSLDHLQLHVFLRSGRARHRVVMLYELTWHSFNAGEEILNRNTRHFPRQQNKQKYQQINWKTFFTGHTELQPSDGRDRTRTRGRGFTWCRGRGVSSKLSTTKWRGGHDFCSACLAFQYSLL